MTKQVNVAIVGATGVVGRTLLQVLQERKFPVAKLSLLASERSQGETLEFHGQVTTVSNLAEFDFKDVDIAFFSAGSEVSKRYVPLAAKQGCIVIDNTSCFRYDDEVPLVIPEVNPVKNIQPGAIIANPNCSTIQMLVALKPIHDAVGIENIIVSTYQAVSGAGQAALNEFNNQNKNLGYTPEALGHQIAKNIIPQIDKMQENNYSREEMKMLWETRKIFNDQAINVSATCVRVPVENAHSEAITIQTRKKISAKEALTLLRKAPGLELVESGYPMPISVSGSDSVFVGRVRDDLVFDNGLSLWVVADNLRKGAATNAVQIAEGLV